jgi:hypothetical protein
MEFSVSKAGTKEPLRSYLWDYGGQDKLIGMHRLYVSPYFVFLLVFLHEMAATGRQSKESGRVSRMWLAQFHFDARVLQRGVPPGQKPSANTDYRLPQGRHRNL